MKIPFWVLLVCFTIILSGGNDFCYAQDDDYSDSDTPAAPPPAQDDCNGIYLQYSFIEREKLYPRVKNASAQAWAFKSEINIVNAGADELKAWKIFVHFQYNEILVSASNAVLINGDDLPSKVDKNGTYFAGYPMSDLKTAIETAGDFSQIAAKIELSGTQFGVKPPGVPMPKTIRLVNDGFKCPATRRRGTNLLYLCCVKDKKFKVKDTKTKFLPRQYGDLSFTYDVLQANWGNYLAQVTIDNNHPLGRLDHWNLTWEWMRGEFIYSMLGAYTRTMDYSACIYGKQGQYYKDFDFSQVMNCDKRPIISDLPREKANDTKVGKIPYCCRNGTLLPKTMDESQARSIFQLTVYKIEPDMNRTALSPPQRWTINGVLNPQYKCGPPIRVDNTQFPDPNGLQATKLAIASWQVTCNITTPKTQASRCCVSFSAYYNESVIPCNTCACGCPKNNTCNPNASPMLLPAEALLVPFDNRTEKAKAWAKIKRLPIPKRLPCPDNCGVSINWHITADYKGGWTARITLFNWEDFAFENWFTAVQLKKASPGFEKVYSFNGTMLKEANNTIFFQGLLGLNYLVGEVNGTNPARDPRVPGKQQSVISFSKKRTPHINILKGDGFPNKVIFNGEECSLPTRIPHNSGYRSGVNLVMVMVVGIATFLMMTEHPY